jgi:sucrose-6-phosphate hydrolase SacC (GH32 family)
VIDRAQIQRKRFSLQLFADDEQMGFPIMIRPETGTLRVGSTEAPFSVCDLADDEDLEIRIFIDKYLVEVFVNEQQAVIGAHMEYQSASGLYLYTYGDPTTIRQIEIWRLRATNQGFFEARENRIWQIDAAE